MESIPESLRGLWGAVIGQNGIGNNKQVPKVCWGIEVPAEKRPYHLDTR